MTATSLGALVGYLIVVALAFWIQYLIIRIAFYHGLALFLRALAGRADERDKLGIRASFTAARDMITVHDALVEPEDR